MDVEEEVIGDKDKNNGKMETTLEKELGFCFGSETSKEENKEGKCNFKSLKSILQV